MPAVCMFVCLSCLLQQFYVKTTERIFTKILPQMNLWSRKNWFNFGSHLPPDPDSDPGIFWRILQHCENKHHFFDNLAYIFADSDRIFMNILSQILGRGSPR